MDRIRVFKIRFVSLGENRGKPCLVCKKLNSQVIYAFGRWLKASFKLSFYIPMKILCKNNVPEKDSF